MAGGMAYTPSQNNTNVSKLSSLSTQVEPNLTKLHTITKQEVVFQVLELYFRSV